MKILSVIVKAIAVAVALLFILFVIFPLCAHVCRADVNPNVTNTVMMVDQNGQLNYAGVASVEDVATNAVNVQIAQAAANAASATARSVTNALNGIVANIVSNNVVIYRYGYSDSFSGMVVFTDSDEFLICSFTKLGLANGVLSCNIGYVCTADLGVIKPIVMAHDTLDGGTTNFVRVADSYVTNPTLHQEQKTIGGVTYDRWYDINVNLPVVGTAPQYFYWLKVDADTPSGDGATLALPNGVTGGVTQTLTWGDKILHFKGGMLLEVENAD